MISNNELKYAEELDKLHDDLALKREEVMRLREVEKELTFYKGKAEGVDGLREQNERLDETNERLRDQLKNLTVEGNES